MSEPAAREHLARGIASLVRLCLGGRGEEAAAALEALEAAPEDVEAEDPAQPGLWDSGAVEA